jgi:hypothetical protein
MVENLRFDRNRTATWRSVSAPDRRDASPTERETCAKSDAIHRTRFTLGAWTARG